MTVDDEKQKALLAGLAVLAAEPTSPQMAAAVDGWLTVFGAMAEGLPPQEPPAGGWERLADRLPPAGLHSIAGALGGPWEPLAPGVARRVFMRAPDGEPLAFLLRVDAGARVDAHPHALREECVVIQGDLRIAGVDLGPGDFHVAEAGTRHASMVSRGGVLAYIRYLDLPKAA